MIVPIVEGHSELLPGAPASLRGLRWGRRHRHRLHGPGHGRPHHPRSWIRTRTAQRSSPPLSWLVGQSLPAIAPFRSYWRRGSSKHGSSLVSSPSAGDAESETMRVARPTPRTLEAPRDGSPRTCVRAIRTFQWTISLPWRNCSITWALPVTRGRFGNSSRT